MEDVIAPKPANENSKNRIIIILTVTALGVCIVVAMFFSKSKQPAKATATNVDFATLEKAVASDPSAANVLKLSARYINHNFPARAFPYLKALIKQQPGNAAAYCDLGLANIMLKNYQQGIDACNKAVQLDPNLQLAKNNLKWGIEERDKVLKTIDDLAARTDDKKDNAYYTLLGLSYYQVGNYDKAVDSWLKGEEKFPESTALYCNDIGSAQIMQKQYAAALASFNKVLSIDRNNQLAKNNILWAESDAAENHH